MTIFYFLGVAGVLAAFIALSRTQKLTTEVKILEAKVQRLSSQLNADTPESDANKTAKKEPPEPANTLDNLVSQSKPVVPTKGAWSESKDKEEQRPHALLISLKDQWMIWLGGACVALAGIYLVRYSIERSLLGPAARFTLSLVLGFGFHIAAEWLRRRSKQTHPAFAALAGAGSITLFASFLAGLHLFELFDAELAFVCLAFVALLTMAMAYVHGPVLAAFGIVGAFAVPALVSSGNGQINVALVYSLIIAASGLLLMRYIYRTWLWWGTLGGALIWWLISLLSNTNGFDVIYLCILGYLATSIPKLDWTLRQSVQLSNLDYRWPIVEDLTEQHLPVTWLLLISATGITSVATADPEIPWLYGLPLLTIALWASRSREQLSWAPWLLSLTILISWIVPQIKMGTDGYELELISENYISSFGFSLILLSIVSTAFSLAALPKSRLPVLVASLACLSPLLCIGVGYTLTSYSMQSWYWGATTLLVALGYLGLASFVKKSGNEGSLVVWMFVAGHLGLALSAAMVFSSASLTLALALQIVSIAWVIKTFDLPGLSWLLKLVVAGVVLRLTLNPWMFSYSSEVHWSLWTFGGATLCALLGMRLLRTYPSAAKWTEGAALHLFVLTVFAEVRYWLNEGEVFSDSFSFAEVTIYVLLFPALGLVYYRRSLVSETLRKLYVGFSVVLVSLGLFGYFILVSSMVVSNAWAWGAVSSTPVFNLLLASFGLPIALSAAFAGYYFPAARRYALGFGGIFVFVFVSLEVRHLWTGTIQLSLPKVSSAELYSYSVVWLVMSIVAMLAGSWRYGQGCYRAGLALLGLVIAKLFLVDMSDLEGLYRVASFMGLGLSLLAVSFLHQRLLATVANTSR